MKPSRTVLIIIAAGILATSCGLLYNPDFADKVANISGSNIITLNRDIGPGDGSLSGRADAYLKNNGIYVSIDGGTYQKANYIYPDWTLPITNILSGLHTVNIALRDPDGKDLSTTSFTYNVPAYVATNGSDANAGNSPDRPFLSLQKGHNSLTNLNGRNGYIYVAEGTYTGSNGGLSNAGSPLRGYYNTRSGICLYGGWRNNFQNRNGLSILDGSGYSYYQIIYFERCKNIQLDGFIIKNAAALGISLYCVTNSQIVNTIVRNNSVGISLSSASNNNISADIIYNTNTQFFDGCGIIIYDSSWNNISGVIVSNYATNHSGGGVHMTNSDHNTINAAIAWNRADIDAGGIYMEGGNNNTINSAILSNRAYTCGGIFLSDSLNYTLNGDIIGNNGGSSLGGGVSISGGSGIINSRNIINNIAGGRGAALYIINLTNAGERLFVLNSIITNSYSSGGGPGAGISIINCTNYRGLMISNCVIGGTNSNCNCGIGEENTVINHILVDNIFIRNLMANLYYDSTRSVYTNDINAVNDPVFSGAAEAHGNRIQ